VHFCTLKKKRYRLQVRKAGQDIVYFSAEDPIAGRLDDDARSFLESLGRARLLCAPDFSLSDYTICRRGLWPLGPLLLSRRSA
jgi:hypothetical protein